MAQHVLVMGGGLAGLSAALRLSRHGYRVTILEQGLHLGGRLGTPPASVMPPHLPVVVMGWHHATLDLLDALGTRSQIRFARRPRLEVVFPDGSGAQWPQIPAPAPGHLLLGVALFRGLSLRDRWRFLMWLERTWEKDPALPIDLDTHTAEAWLRTIGQSDTARARLWAPLCRFLVGDDARTASASAFLSTLIRAFLSTRRHGQMAIPSQGVDALLVEPLRSQLVDAGVTITLDDPLTRIYCDAHRITAVESERAGKLTADWYLAALPRHRLMPLLPERALTRFSYFHQLDALADAPALVVHLEMSGVSPSPRLLLLAELPFHWLVSRSFGHDRSLVSLVRAGTPDSLAWTDQDALAHARQVVQIAMPQMRTATVAAHRIVRLPVAFLSMRPGSRSLRPLAQSPLPNLVLAGDWTDTGLPSTLEGAIASGELAVKAITAKESRGDS